MRLWSAFILILLLLSGPLHAQESRRDQIAAASSNALESLRAQVAQSSIGENLTVADLLKRTHGSETLMKTLARAQQIGGPRRLDEQSYQVRLEISGQRVRAALLQIAGSNPKTTPIDATLLSARLADWDRRTFSATGSSAGGASVDQARPIDADGAWAAVSDEARCAAIHDAKQNAVARVLESIRPIPLAPGRTVGDVLAVPSVHQSLRKWLVARPVTQIEFRDDLQVRVTLIALGDELFDAFRAAATAQKDVPLPTEAVAWSGIRGVFESRAGAAEGRATAVPGDAPRAGRAQRAASAATGAVPPAATNAAVPAFQLPRTPPEWMGRQIEADGSGTVKGNPLKSARAAEADASAGLRAQLDALALTPELTLGHAARREPRLAAALTRGLARARTARTDYLPDGGARVHVVLDLGDVWQEIEQAF
jgi:hypothetical protein